MTKQDKKHWDASGHEIWDYFRMRDECRHFRNYELLRTHPPHKIIVHQSIKITITIGKKATIVLQRFWAGPTKTRVIDVNAKQMKGLRNLYRRCVEAYRDDLPCTWQMTETKDAIIFIKDGAVTVDPLRRLGVWF